MSAGKPQRDDGAVVPLNEQEEISFLDIMVVIVENRWLLLVAPVLAGLLALGAGFMMTPVFTGRAVVLPPQQSSGAAAMLQTMGGLAGLAGATGGLKNPADQYAALIQSNTVSDRVAKKFDLQSVYQTRSAQETRETLKSFLNVGLGKRDGLMTIEVTDTDPKRAADIANNYVEQLRRFTSELAVTEAQQRRLFFERQMLAAKEKLTQAQQALQGSGIDQGALRVEPKAAADAYAAIKAQVTAAEVQLQSMRGYLTENAPEYKQKLLSLGALRRELQKAEMTDDTASGSGDYVGKYREFKYQETLFELFARQYEMAKLDESRDGTLFQVVDAAVPPEKKSGPRRASLALAVSAATGVCLLVFVFLRQAWRSAAKDGGNAEKMQRLRAALR